MKTIELIQGTPEWHAHRLQHHNASDAPAMLGCSPYKSRTQLLTEMKTGLSPEVDGATQRRFDDGHRFEALARPLAEQIVGEDLYPVVGTLGKLSASFDGLTMAEDVAFEHKTLNSQLKAALMSDAGADALPKAYRVQMEQQCMVSGAERVLFMASKWAGDTLVEEVHAWYEPDAELRAEIIAGWKQFEKDLAAYVPEEGSAPAPVGRAPEALPALHIVLKGEVSASNLAEFKEVALTAIRSVNRDLQTDQDFANSAKARKWCEDIEARVAAAKDHALSQTVSIDLLFKTMDEVSAEAREVRLALEKLEKARSLSKKGEIVAGGVKELADHIAALNTRLGKPYMPAASVDLGGVIKGMRSFDSMQDAVDTAVANAKIAANSLADRIDANLKHLNTAAADYLALFPDVAALVLKEPQDFEAQVQFRVAEQRHREEQRAEALRETIRQQEQAKATAAATAAQVVQTAAATPPPASPTTAPAAVTPLRTTPSSAPAAAPAQDSPATLLIGGINRRLGFDVNAIFLKQLGFEPARIDGARRFYRDSDLPLIGLAIAEHAVRVTELQTA